MACNHFSERTKNGTKGTRLVKTRLKYIFLIFYSSKILFKLFYVGLLDYSILLKARYELIHESSITFHNQEFLLMVNCSHEIKTKKRIG